MSMIACYQMVDVKMINELLEKSAEEVFETIEELQEMDDNVLDIDKLWDGLHFLLTNVTASEPIEGNLLSEAVVGVKKFCDDEDSDFISYVLPNRVSTIMNELMLFNIDIAIDKFNPKEFAQNGIYPNIWMKDNKEVLQEELKEHFFALLDFYKKAAELQKAVIVSIY